MTDKPGDSATAGSTSAADWWLLAVLACCYTFYSVDRSLFAILAEPLKLEFGLTDGQIGLLTGLASTLPFAIVCIPMGLLADRVVRRDLLSVLVGAWSFATTVTYFAASIPFLFLSRVGIGTFEAGFSSTSLSLLSDTFPQRLRSTVLALFGLGTPAGLFLGMTLGGYIDQHHGWRAAFLIAGLPGLLLAIVLRTTTKEPVRGRHDSGFEDLDSSSGLVGALRSIWRNRGLFSVMLAMTWCNSMIAVFTVWTPSMLRRSFALDATDAGIYAGLVAGIAGSVGAAIGGVIADRFGKRELRRKLVPAVAGTAIGMVFGLTALLGDFALTPTLIMLSLSAAFCQFYLGTCYGMIATLASPSIRTTALAIQLLSANLFSYTLASYLVGHLSDLFQPTYGAMALRHAFVFGFIFSAMGILQLIHTIRVMGPGRGADAPRAVVRSSSGREVG